MSNIWIWNWSLNIENVQGFSWKSKCFLWKDLAFNYECFFQVSWSYSVLSLSSLNLYLDVFSFLKKKKIYEPVSAVHMCMFVCVLKTKTKEKKIFRQVSSRALGPGLYCHLRLDSLHWGGCPWAVWAIQLYPWSLPLDSNYHPPSLIRATSMSPETVILWGGKTSPVRHFCLKRQTAS